MISSPVRARGPPPRSMKLHTPTVTFQNANMLINIASARGPQIEVLVRVRSVRNQIHYEVFEIWPLIAHPVCIQGYLNVGVIYQDRLLNKGLMLQICRVQGVTFSRSRNLKVLKSLRLKIE
ncbi:hypothetical protein EVAR_38173_1 [Eumeta japonica]|uniref:Uncharacterized protein n=1 Tax=Eumeta variegata TaxID=151549 RepID=A0A4C1WGZ4_EUMVA|nr:hypothetical protein EVAR_38173_1 [Eumeta japonica]